METAAQSILRKAPPADLEKNLKGLQSIVSDDEADSLQWNNPLPLRTLDVDEKGEKPFLLCQYNAASKNQFRSPWTGNMYDADGKKLNLPKEEVSIMRYFEGTVNSVWESYKNSYYGHESVGSVYLKEDPAGTSFTGMFLVHKLCSSGSWDALHVVRVAEPTDEMCYYQVESKVLVTVATTSTEGDTSPMEISALLSKETAKECKFHHAQVFACHIENMGTLIEANEIDLRSQTERVQVPKMQEILDDLQKQEQKMPAQVNPLMGMIMGSDLLKKKLAAGGGD